jgi:hypothetical protein
VGDDVWAVGLDRFPGPSLIMHSAGGEPWQLTSYSSPGDPLFTSLSGVHATTSDDVWADGEAWAAGQATPGRAVTGFKLFDARDQ